MGFIGGDVGVRLMTLASRRGTAFPDVAPAYAGRSKIETLLGPQFWDQIKGKVVLDFGSGTGAEAVEMAERGAARVIGLEIRQKWLDVATKHASDRGVSDRCFFTRESSEAVDLVLSMDSFEHFDDPAAILKAMHALLKPTGRVIATFGPTWYHPLGGHIFSVFPYSHLIFTESALLKWRRGIKGGTATTFGQVGLNQMTIRRFEELVEASPLRFEQLEAVPIKRLRRLANPWTREFTTAIVRCVLVPRK